MKKGFTLIEMLVVVGIIMILIGASVTGYSKMTKTAEKARAQELVSNTATAMTALYQKTGYWPKKLAQNGSGDGLLDKDTAFCLKDYMNLNVSQDGTQLIGIDQFGIVTPWAVAAIKNAGATVSEGTRVANTSKTVANHRLHYALDLDGDGILTASVGGETVVMRATAAVWCVGKTGGDESGNPWPYSKGRRRDDVYSWSFGQTQNVK